MQGEPIFYTNAVERIREGMRVVDADGKDLGAVAYVKLGDPDSVTAEEQALADPPANLLGRADEPDVPGPLRARLLRLGFIKVDAPGLLAEAPYVQADRIAGVLGDTVTLSPAVEETRSATAEATPHPSRPLAVAGTAEGSGVTRAATPFSSPPLSETARPAPPMATPEPPMAMPEPPTATTAPLLAPSAWPA